ncbi:MAG: hypothetical protein KF721_09720 [Ignavibacteriaceae bacterium]|nr:hypothetical protein [Ignavibacteriaceae bacterium]
MQKIISCLKKNDWKFREIKKYCRNNYLIGYKIINNIAVTLDIFNDGYAIFTIHEKARNFNNEYEFDPVSLNSQKTDIHKKLLTSSHSLSSELNKTKQALWKIFPNRLRRKSANTNWENAGFSYVFSFFIIQISPMYFRNKNFVEKITTLLFPMAVEEVTTSALMDQTRSIIDHSSSLGKKLEESTIAEFPYRKIYFTWATSVIVGEVTSNIVFNYCKTMRELQHAWFSAYITDRNLDYIVNNIKNINSINKLIKLDSSISNVSREISLFTSIPDSMATNVILRTQKIASKESGLDSISQSINSKLLHVRNEITTRIEKRNYRGSRKVEFILVLLTIIQAISAYKSISTTGGLSFTEIILFGFIFLFVLLIILIR